MISRTTLASLACLSAMALTLGAGAASAEGSWRRDALRALGSAANSGGNHSGPAAEGTVSAADPQSLVDAILAEGYRAELSTDSEGDPHIKSGAAGVNYDIDFYGCTEGESCDTICFTAGFDLENGSTPDVVNDWNSNEFIGPAYLDSELDPYLDYCVVGVNGMQAEGFSSVLDNWSRALGDFQGKIGF
ncbi:YbjN domain-containing protein [Oceanicella sp. SM1341]|uniref:YbjN domain-containing protein n=1 Tax=Oceanicella sp. SM1341 TaxID=1548889 RepID=UPI000E54FE63|nr:YbjN domain-containing protein [Oceanicella sp. SM1341]